jgi:dolichyl-phosphate beta-glucosyltransferase
MRPDLSIVIPAYQEAGVIESSLITLADYLKEHHLGKVEVIVVTADSPDGTTELAEAQAEHFHQFRVIRAGARVGKGRDVRLGMLAATGRYRLFMDADLATPLSHLEDVKLLMARDIPLMIAVRNLWGIHKGLKRKMITKGGNWLAQIILLPGIKDTQCGFKLMRSDVCEAVFRRMTILGWGFDLEILAIARSLGYPIANIEAPDWRDPKAVSGGLAGDSPTGAAVQVLRDLLTIRLNLWHGRYRQPNLTD